MWYNGTKYVYCYIYYCYITVISVLAVIYDGWLSLKGHDPRSRIADHAPSHGRCRPDLRAGLDGLGCLENLHGFGRWKWEKTLKWSDIFIGKIWEDR